MSENYNKKMYEIIEGNREKKRLLLHCCCAPCASSSLERVLPFFEVTAFFYNPNIDSISEYNLRAEELKKYCESLGVKCIIEPFNSSEFYDRVKGLEFEAERGKRCDVCFSLRLHKTAKIAKENNYDFFATTLTLSPLKDEQKINEIGYNLANKNNINYLPTDFKKQGGYIRSIELSKEYNLYRQNYCGCKFSKR